MHRLPVKVIPPVAIVAYLLDGTGYACPTRETLERWCDAEGVEATFMTIINLG